MLPIRHERKETTMIIKTSIDTATELQNLFAEYGRDDYEIATYEGIIEFYKSVYGDEPQEFDVIGWCCDLTEESPVDTVNNYDELETLINEHRESEDEDYTPWEDDSTLSEEEDKIVEEFINEHTIIITFNSETIAYLAF